MSKAAWLSAAVLLSLPAFAQDALNMQAGLWELKTTKMVMDGVDRSAQMSQAAAQMQAAMASMPPEQRAKMEAMMSQRGASMSASGGTMTVQICRTAEQAKNHTIPTGQNGQCQSSYSQSGGVFSFTYSCPTKGGTASGKGSVSRSGDVLTIVSDGTTTGASGSHTMQSEVQMRYLGADCGTVKSTPVAPNP
jgi:hypothetical protein